MEILVPGERAARKVVVDAEHEVVLGLVLFKVIESGLDEGRGELARAQAVAAADYLGQDLN
ncbi:hypothetical protein MASR2M48_23800 [Spirochaetota bacterium]